MTRYFPNAMFLIAIVALAGAITGCTTLPDPSAPVSAPITTAANTDSPTTRVPPTGMGEPRIVKWPDINYFGADSPNPAATSLDIYGAENLKRAPVMLFIHGGGWSRGDKTNAAQYKPEFFVGSGYVFVNINYRLVPEIAFPANVEDVAKAIAWTSDNISTYGGDPDRIFVSGHSAGAHLAALAATDGKYLEALGKDLTLIKGCVPLDSAGYDINYVMESARSRGVPKTIYERAFTTDPEIWTAASPSTWVSFGKGIPPFMLVHVASRVDSGTASRKLAEKLRNAGVRAEVFPAANKTHATVNRQLGLDKDPPTAAIIDFLSTIGGNPAASVHYVSVPPEGMVSTRRTRVGPVARKLFRRWDANRDGRLTRDEIPEANQNGFTEADENEDGFVSEKELSRYKRN